MFDAEVDLYVFEVLGWEDLTEETHCGMKHARCKVEYAFQCIQQLVVDAMSSGVITVPAPILTRSFQELGAGMLVFHEAKKLSRVRLPLAYRLIAFFILVLEAVFVPFVMATKTSGLASCFWITSCGTFLLWFLNGVAESLDNPFKKSSVICGEASSMLNTAEVQRGLNDQLADIRRFSSQPLPSLR